MRRILGTVGTACEEEGEPEGTGDQTDNEVRMKEAIHGYIAAHNTDLSALKGTYTCSFMRTEIWMSASWIC